MKTIFFVDDEKYINTPFVEFLELHDYNVIFVNSISEGELLFKEKFNQIDLVLLDVMMGIKDEEIENDPKLIKQTDSGYSAGIYLYKQFTNFMNEKKKKIPIIFLTARFNLGDGLSDELKDVSRIIKPTDPNSIISQIQDLLNIKKEN
jgi:CheY-like chemotaxis protein